MLYNANVDVQCCPLFYFIPQRCTLFVNVVNCLSGWFIVLQDCKSIYNVIKACTLLCDDVRFWTMLYNIMNSLYMFCIVFQAYTLLSKVVYCCTSYLLCCWFLIYYHPWACETQTGVHHNTQTTATPEKQKKPKSKANHP